MDWREGSYDGVTLRTGTAALDELVEERYPDADCRTANEGTEYTNFPLCEVRACEGRLLAFGGDPIESVWLVAETAAGWRSCRDPTRADPPETR